MNRKITRSDINLSEAWKITRSRGKSELKRKLMERLGRNCSFTAKELLLCLLKDSDKWVRYDAADLVGYYRGSDVVRGLMERLNDSNELVRINALESLGYIKARKAAKRISLMMKDSKYIIRGYAGSVLGELAVRKYMKLIRIRYVEEGNEWVRLMFLRGLQKLGENVSIWDYVRFWFSTNYHVRCMLVNTMADLAKGANKQIVLDFFRYGLSVEKSRSVSSTIRTCISEIRHRSNSC